MHQNIINAHPFESFAVYYVAVWCPSLIRPTGNKKDTTHLEEEIAPAHNVWVLIQCKKGILIIEIIKFKMYMEM